MTLRVFITGGGGMVGRNLLELLPRQWIIAAPTRRELDLFDYDNLVRFVRDFKPDAIVHAAGKVGGIQANIAAPVDFMVQNVDIGRNVILAAQLAGVDRILNLASSCIYPRDRDGILNEHDLLSGPLERTNEGYAIAKIFTLKLCEYLNIETKDRRFKTLIPCNLYGKYDHFEENVSHLVPAIIRKIHSAKESGCDTVEIWGDGTARREFMFAGDFAKMIIRALADFSNLPDLMNVGVGMDYSVLDYYQTAAQVIDWSGTFVFDRSKPAGMRRKLISVDRQRAWGWAPETSLYEGIAATYKYYEAEMAQ
ncbi:GDP-L-fucose synthase [Methylobacterium sp. C25]|uniref:GDP-L-fucose synthase family protein n=1 Tax=Methylobacterium sp. C25 TaxID=2721622 RepID=UPI001F1C3AC8|nr:GDP-L-fucose synthase [Methylobacterium sp. C25]MCE4226370.1 GDP-L-fucose synthase [Methylobacterium sp. C25]